MKTRRPPKPRQGWVYMVSASKTVVRCKAGHEHWYEYSPQLVECQESSCSLTVNPSRVLRGEHPYVVWSRNEFQDTYGKRVGVATVIPLSSSGLLRGLPTVYPIKPTTKNGLTKLSYALVHQITTIDLNSFKKASGGWKTRLGQLDKSDKGEIEHRLRYYLNLLESEEDWLAKNARPELLLKVYARLSDEQKESVLDSLLDSM